MSNPLRDGVLLRVCPRRAGPGAAVTVLAASRRLSVVVCLLVLVALWSLWSAPAAHAAPQGGVVVGAYAEVVNSPILHLRTGPGLRYALILTMPGGAVVKVLDGPFAGDDYDWLKVSYQGTVGFAADRWLAPTRAPKPLAPGSLAHVVNSQILHLRWGPGLAYDIILTMTRGAVVTVKDGPFPNNGYQWYKVSYKGTIGFAADRWLAAISSPPPPEQVVVKVVAVGEDAEVVNNPILRLRTGPGTNYPIILTMPEWAIVHVEEGPEYGSGYTWWCVSYKGTRGYAAAPWLAPSGQPAS